jgi:hypothetical protein
MNEPKSGAVLLITHTRVEQLNKVLNSLENSWINEYRDFFVVVHDNHPEVKMIIQSSKKKTPTFIEVNRERIDEPREAISRNIFDGLSQAFQSLNIGFVTVIEDDIQVKKDFLRFNYEIVKLENENPRFRGVNGFSGAVFDESREFEYGKFRYGFGWGWTVTRKTWESVKEIWSEDFHSHWDSLIEKVVRDGYVAMPHNSRILNLGFDETATHTSDGGTQEQKLHQSFRESDVTEENRNLICSEFNLNWRLDAIGYLEETSIRGWTSNLAWRAFNSLSFPSDTAIFVKIIKSRLRGLLLRLLLVI